MNLTEEQIKEGLDRAYKKAGNNAYFGNGFKAGVEFALKLQNTAYTKFPSLKKVLDQFDFDRDKPVTRAKQVDAITQVYDIIKKLGNFA